MYLLWFWLGHTTAMVKWSYLILMLNTTTTIPKKQCYSRDKNLRWTTVFSIAVMTRLVCDRDKSFRHEPEIEYVGFWFHLAKLEQLRTSYHMVCGPQRVELKFFTHRCNVYLSTVVFMCVFYAFVKIWYINYSQIEQMWNVIDFWWKSGIVNVFHLFFC